MFLRQARSNKKNDLALSKLPTDFGNNHCYLVFCYYRCHSAGLSWGLHPMFNLMAPINFPPYSLFSVIQITGLEVSPWIFQESAFTSQACGVAGVSSNPSLQITYSMENYVGSPMETSWPIISQVPVIWTSLKFRETVSKSCYITPIRSKT